MREYAYMLVTDSTAESEEYYQKYFHWTIAQKNTSFLMIDTKSPLKFGLVEKKYLIDALDIKDEDILTNSFCTWLYDSEEELMDEKEALLKKGVFQIGNTGRFFKDQKGMLWELRVKGDVI
ncbi:MAG: hypothetical protein HFH03_10630 [Dorea sp.]|jgi:hypothetical protein|nr:hypothetical protein [Dorea sp.]